MITSGHYSCSFPVTARKWCDPSFIRPDSKIVDYWWAGDNFNFVLENGQEFFLIDAEIVDSKIDGIEEIKTEKTSSK